ncbi:Putative two-component sensor histidine kinase, hybrid system [Magnetospirillum molischianum DSM 120]|uniref:Sensory/regulatory protein RpfC n=2 Tax=Magnetospirillum molischianum TaxID=1083 RepID=H8FMY4_MAGML|nr:Putative two-component sensor histidine kinase, hybrid system [Magnetospirillum molischianum DSM 120]
MRLLPLGSTALLAVLGGSFLAITIIGLIGLWEMREAGLSALATEMNRTALFTARSLSRPIYDYDYELVTTQLDALRSDPEIVAVFVNDVEGVQIGFIGNDRPIDSSLLIDLPVIHSSNEGPVKVGRLRIYYSRDALDSAVRQATMEGASALIGAFLFLASFIIITFRSLTYPICNISSVMLRLARGEDVAEIPALYRKDEIGDIARSLDVFRCHARKLLRLQEEKAAEQIVREGEQHLRLIIESMPVMIVLLSRANGTVIYANPLMRDAVLGDGTDPQGIPATAFLDAASWTEVEAAALDHSTDREILFRRHDGSTFWGMVSGRTLEIGGDEALLLGINDVTDLRRTRDALIAAKEEAESATRIKSEFLATMSHEIRTPMNGIVGMTDLLLDTPLTEDQRRMADTIHASAESLLTIINDILDYSKIEAGHFDIDEQPFCLRTLIEGGIDIVSPRLKGKSVDLLFSIAPEADATFIGDEVRIRQIMLNLLGNAVKFTEFGTVRLSADYVDGFLTITIEDTGIGIPAAAQERLFDKFIQADSSTSRRFGGTGLGLAISLKLAKVMGGKINFSSAEGQGSTFLIRLPLVRSSPPRPLERPLAGLSLLLVENGIQAATLLTADLTALGADVIQAASAPEALATARAAQSGGTPFDALVVDHDMPFVTGTDLLVMLKAEPFFAATRCVLTVNDASARAIAETLENVVVTTKPIHALRLARDLTATSAPEEPQPSASERPATGPSLHILLVEDNRINQEVARGFLSSLGHDVEIASNAVEGVAMVVRNTFDLVLMDVQLPDMDGYRATQLIRSLDGPQARVPVIAMTANAMEGDRDRCLAAGMDDYLSKPIRRPILAATLARWGGGGSEAR